jgi:hypothetical protein
LKAFGCENHPLEAESRAFFHFRKFEEEGDGELIRKTNKKCERE